MEDFDNSVQNSKKILESYMEKYGLERTIDLLKNIGNDLFWMKYKEVKEIDDNDSIFQINDIEYDEDLNNLTINEVKKIWDVFSTNEEAQKIITNSMSEVKYDLDDTETRLDVMYILISAIELLDEVPSDVSDNFNLLYDETNKKLAELDIKDFYIVYSNIISSNFFNNSKFKKVIEDKVNAMTTSEFVYFLRTAESDLNAKNTEIMEIIKDKTIKLDSNFVNKVYTTENHVKFPKINISEGKLDNVTRLIKGIENQEEAIKTLTNLTDVEFISYLYYYYDNEELLDKKILNSEEFKNRIKKLSRRDIVFLIEKFGDAYYSIKDIKVDENEDEVIVSRMKKFIEYGMQWKDIFDEALERNVVTDNSDVKHSYNVLYLKGELEEIVKMEPIYSANKYIGFVPFFYPTSEECDEIHENEEDEENEYVDYPEGIDLDEEDVYPEEYEEHEDEEFSDFDEDDEYSKEINKQIELEFIENLYNNLDELLEFYDVLDGLYKTSDLKILQMANHYNVKYKDDDLLKMEEIQQYIIRYLKSRIINMPNKYASFFINIKDGCLDNVMRLKEEEMQDKFLNKSQDNNSKDL